MLIVVAEEPVSGWDRLRWRAARAWNRAT
jgi:hypothetical protein